MSPLRIIIIAILIYLAFRLITGGGKKSKTDPGRQKKPPREMPVSDTLEEDPICKKLVPRQQAIQFEYRGRKHYFCSQECCKSFRTKLGENS